MDSKTLKEDFAYADDLMMRCESLPEEEESECTKKGSDQCLEDDRAVFFLEKDSDVFDYNEDENLTFSGFAKGNGKPLPTPSAESIQKAKIMLGSVDPVPEEENVECNFKNGKGEPWEAKNAKKSK